MGNGSNPQINLSKIPVGGGIAGGMVMVASMLIFLVGIPALRYFLPAAIGLGGVVALAMRGIRHEPVGRAWLNLPK